MESISLSEVLSSRFQFTIGLSIVLGVVFLFSLRRPELPANTPKTVIKGLPILGSWNFFTERWSFCQNAVKKSASGNFSFWAGQYPVIGVSGEEARKVIFGERGMSMQEGYRVLLGGSPGDRDNPIDSEYFTGRLAALLKGNALRRCLPSLLEDVRESMEQLDKSPSKIMNPFETIYGLIFQLTMRTIGCKEIANDPKAMKKLRTQFETIDEAGSKPMTILFPRFPTIHSIRRLIAGIGTYKTINSIINDRKKTGRREEDAMQYLLDQGDNAKDIVQFILGGLFAGLLNTGINAAWIIIYLSKYTYWREKILGEIKTAADKYAPDSSQPLRERIHQIPIEAWETEFPTIDYCLKDSLRLTLNGTVFRRNITGQDIHVSKTEVVPSKAYAVYHVGDVHYNPEIYSNPWEWDPSRYLPDRAEDKKVPWGWLGWGVGRHPCLGMRFAKLECFMLVAFWFTYFESENVDKDGNPTEKLPRNDFEAHTARKPLDNAYVKYWARED